MQVSILTSVDTGVGQPCSSGQYIKVRKHSGYLAKVVAMETDRGTRVCPWLIEVQEGQRINITLLDFSSSHKNTNSVIRVCHVGAVIRDKAEPRGIKVCVGRDTFQYVSKSNVVEVRLVGNRDSNNQDYFLLHYQGMHISVVFH